MSDYQYLDSNGLRIGIESSVEYIGADFETCYRPFTLLEDGTKVYIHGRNIYEGTLKTECAAWFFSYDEALKIIKKYCSSLNFIEFEEMEI